MLQILKTVSWTTSCTLCDYLNQCFVFSQRWTGHVLQCEVCIGNPIRMSSFPFPQFSRLLKPQWLISLVVHRGKPHCLDSIIYSWNIKKTHTNTHPISLNINLIQQMENCLCNGSYNLPCHLGSTAALLSACPSYCWMALLPPPPPPSPRSQRSATNQAAGTATPQSAH